VTAAVLHIVGRYALHGEIASGGMATVHYGRLLGPAGFSRTVAIKRLHPHLAKDPEFVAMFLDEARLAAHVRHPNVVGTLDVVARDAELFVVMDYVQGESLARLMRVTFERGERVRPAIAVAIVMNVLAGLQAAHDAVDEHGEPLLIVHRDVSPPNVLVGVDGLARVADFGVAKAQSRIQTTRDGQLKGKLAYMPPEQIRGKAGPRSDVYAAAVVLWELLAGRRLFQGDEAKVLYDVMTRDMDPPGRHAPDLPMALDAATLRALEKDPERRFATASEMARALEAALRPASIAEVGDWVRSLAGKVLDERLGYITRLETAVGRLQDPPTTIDPIANDESTVDHTGGPSERVTVPAIDDGGTLVTASSPVVLPRARRGAWLVAALAVLVASVGAGVFFWRGSGVPVAAGEPAGSAAGAAPPVLEPLDATRPDPSNAATASPPADEQPDEEPAASTARRIPPRRSLPTGRVPDPHSAAPPTLERVLDTRK
jgi:eukaryotic-like serine/threonine-protein kinase